MKTAINKLNSSSKKNEELLNAFENCLDDNNLEWAFYFARLVNNSSKRDRLFSDLFESYLNNGDRRNAEIMINNISSSKQRKLWEKLNR